MACASRNLVDGHFGGGLSPAREHALREHLPTCAECTAHYQRHLVLEKLDPAALGAEERLARGLGFAPKRAPWFSLPVAVGFAAAAAALLFVVLPTQRHVGFGARGGNGPAPIEVRAYRVSGGHSEPLGATVPSDVELAFSYANRAPKRYLMIFGVDEHKHVYWFYPSWTDPKLDPAAVPISPAETQQELPDAVSQKLDGATLHLQALFLDEPATVKQVESQLAKGGIQLQGALGWSQDVKVSR